MALLVLKFGGTSVADLDRMRNAVGHIKREVDAGHKVAVIVSAMAGVTNELIELTKKAAFIHDAREYDSVVSTGEQVSSGIISMLLQNEGIPARSWLGWQVPIKTDGVHGAARMIDVDGSNIKERLDQGHVAVISGFQGIGPDNRITTLGRGGSDTSAVAIAAALNADLCDIYTDVNGVYTTDPRIVKSARKIDRITYEEMLELASLGAKVLQTRSVELSMNKNVPLHVRSSLTNPIDYEPYDENNWKAPGTLVCNEDMIVEEKVISGIAYTEQEAMVTILNVKDKPGVAADVFVPLADANINVDMIIQNVSRDGKFANMTFTVPNDYLNLACDTLEKEKNEGRLSFETIGQSTNVTKVSVIGVGMRSHAGVASKLFNVLAEQGINIITISTSEIKISVLIDTKYTELALRALHSAYELDN